MMFQKRFVCFSSIVVWCLVSCASPGEEDSSSDLPKIGIVLPSEDSPRWLSDRDGIIAALAGKASTTVHFSGDSVAVELQAVEALIEQRIDVLLLCPVDSTQSAGAVDRAKAAGVKVVSHDRLVLGTAGLDFFVTFDGEQIGRAQGQYLVDTLGTSGGRALYLYAGAPSDNNALVFFASAWKVLQPKVASGSFIVQNSPTAASMASNSELTSEQLALIVEEITTNWSYEGAETLALANFAAPGAQKGAVSVLAPNDQAARAIINVSADDPGVTALTITGQDAEVESIQSIIDGRQTMTVLKDIRTLARDAAAVALSLAQGTTPTAPQSYNNGAKDVPTRATAIVVVDRSNLDEAIFDSGYYSRDEFAGL